MRRISRVYDSALGDKSKKRVVSLYAKMEGRYPSRSTRQTSVPRETRVTRSTTSNNPPPYTPSTKMSSLSEFNQLSFTPTTTTVTGTKRTSFAAQLDQDPTLSTSKRSLRSGMFKEEMQIRELNTKLHTALSRIEVLENESVGREKELESVKSDRRILDGRCGEREKELEDARALWEGEKVIPYYITLSIGADKDDRNNSKVRFHPYEKRTSLSILPSLKHARH